MLDDPQVNFHNDSGVGHPLVVGPGFANGHRDDIPSDTFHKIATGEKRLYFAGWLKYNDGFEPEEARRISRFCYEITFEFERDHTGAITGTPKNIQLSLYKKFNVIDEVVTEL